MLKRFVLLVLLGGILFPFLGHAQTRSEIDQCKAGIGAREYLEGIRFKVDQLRTRGWNRIAEALNSTHNVPPNGMYLPATVMFLATSAEQAIRTGDSVRGRELRQEAIGLLKRGYAAYSRALQAYDETYELVKIYCTYNDGRQIVSLSEAESTTFFNEANDKFRQISDLGRELDGAAGEIPPLPFGVFEAVLPGITERTIDQFNTNSDRKPILRYLSIAMNLIIAAIVAIGLIIVVIAGYLYITAGGSSQRVGLAKELMGAALLGIVLALAAFLILNTIGAQFASDLREPSLTP